jgi:hypothetical protein
MSKIDISPPQGLRPEKLNFLCEITAKEIIVREKAASMAYTVKFKIFADK